MTDKVLNNHQMLTLMQHSSEFDEIAPSLSLEMQGKLLVMQRRIGDAYAGKGEAPSEAETKDTLSTAYISLNDKRKDLREIMDKMDIMPSFLNKRSFIGGIVHGVQGMFR